MKTICLEVNVSSAKTNILSDGAITAKVKLFVSDMQRDTGLFIQQDLIAVTGLIYAVLPTMFSRENSLVSLCMTEKIKTFAIIVRLRRNNIDIEADSFHKELKCGFCFVMIVVRHVGKSTENMSFHRKYVIPQKICQFMTNK